MRLTASSLTLHYHFDKIRYLYKYITHLRTTSTFDLVTVQDFPKSKSTCKVTGWNKAVAMTPGRWVSQEIEAISETRGQLLDGCLTYAVLAANILTMENRAYPKQILFLGKVYLLRTRLNQKKIIEISDAIYVASTNGTLIKNYLTAWLRQQANAYIVRRTKLMAEKAGLKHYLISMSDAGTRWGSCSNQKNLQFNWRLIMAPQPVIDYVISHELAHLKEMNHSRQFWETVRKIFPLYRQYRTWLKRHGDSLKI